MKGCLVVFIVLGAVLWFWNSGEEPEDKGLTFVKTHGEIRALLKDADHVGVYTVESKVGLREFISSMMAYQPWWVTQLYKARGVLVRVLGMKQEEMPQAVLIPPDRVPLEKGAPISFFTVVMAKEKSYWVVKASDKHLTAHLAVVAEPENRSKLKKFHLVVVVHYHNWAGPVYFNLIRPFEHIIVKNMALEGAKGAVAF